MRVDASIGEGDIARLSRGEREEESKRKTRAWQEERNGGQVLRIEEERLGKAISEASLVSRESRETNVSHEAEVGIRSHGHEVVRRRRQVNGKY